MRSGVIAHSRATHFVVDDGIELVADANRLLGDHTMRAHTLHGKSGAFNFGDEGVVVVGVEPAGVADLSTGLGVEGRVVEDDLAALAGKEYVSAQAGGLKPAGVKNRRFFGTTEVVP